MARDAPQGTYRSLLKLGTETPALSGVAGALASLTANQSDSPLRVRQPWRLRVSMTVSPCRTSPPARRQRFRGQSLRCRGLAMFINNIPIGPHHPAPGEQLSARARPWRTPGCGDGYGAEPLASDPCEARSVSPLRGILVDTIALVDTPSSCGALGLDGVMNAARAIVVARTEYSGVPAPTLTLAIDDAIRGRFPRAHASSCPGLEPAAAPPSHAWHLLLEALRPMGAPTVHEPTIEWCDSILVLALLPS